LAIVGVLDHLVCKIWFDMIKSSISVKVVNV
jgi:hypothetical protein